ncbi:MAG: HNH endonuclease [Chloroflexi bacterium]|nr:HNH endonuclease [Chloroflexota bacterium]
MLGEVLVLNASFEPLNIVPVRRAVVLLLKEKAEVVEAAQRRIHSGNGLALDWPLVIRLVYFVKIPAQFPLPLNRRTVMARDQYTCQYCGIQPSKAGLTLDHIVPRARGGKSDWKNVVSACIPCNQRKGGHTPQEAGMSLLSRPDRPRYAAVVLLGRVQGPTVWRKYIPH